MLSDSTDFLAPAAIVISLVSLAWTISQNARQSKADRISQTRLLFETFMSYEMICFRDEGWFFLDDIENCHSQVTFSSLWSDPNPEIREPFDKLYHVLEF